MSYHMLPRMACSSAILLFALAHCGCTSMNGWGTAWQSKPKGPANPNDKETVSYLGQKKPQKTINADELQSRMNKAAETDRSRVYADQLAMARKYLKEKRLDDAKKCYERALSVRPNDPDCYHGLAVIADDQKQFDVAEKNYQAALKVRPHDANLLSDYGYSHYLRENDRQAEKILNEALAINPSNGGAMANLAVIYQKQGRADEAWAMFRRGAPDAEAKRYMAKMFPQYQLGGAGEIALAQNANSGPPRTAPPMPPDDGLNAADLKGKSSAEVKEIMNRRKELDEWKRNERMQAELQPPRRNYDEFAAQRPASGYPQSGQAWANNANGGQPGYNGANPGQAQIMLPGVTTPQSPNAQQYAANPNGYSGSANGMNPGQAGQIPENAFWEGARVQTPSLPQGTVPPQGIQPPPNGSNSGWNQPQQFAANDQAQFNPNGNRFAPNGLQPSLGSDPSSQYPATNAQYTTDNTASAAAAQLGMNAGPGGMFPVVNPDAVAQTGFAAPAAPGSSSRFGHEFPSPPQFQNPPAMNPQNQPPQSAPPNTGAYGRNVRQGPPQNQNPVIAPQSPAGDWGNFGPQSPSQGMGTTQGQDGFPTINSGGANNRAGGSNWGDAPSGGALPYNGPWPNNNTQPPPNSFLGNGGGGNSLPTWNQGGTGYAPQPKIIGPASQNSSSNTLEPWPYAPRQ